jgi:hypothetical protein
MEIKQAKPEEVHLLSGTLPPIVIALCCDIFRVSLLFVLYYR